MIRLSQLNPINLLEEKEKFFKDQSYNPQFIYQEPIAPDELIEHGIPDENLLELAKDIIKKALFGRNQRDLLLMEGPVVPHEEVTKKLQAFLALHNLEHRFKIVWSSSFISRATINVDTVKLRSSAEFRKEGLIGMLYHEIGTHALRRVNYEQQPWFKKRNAYGFGSYLKTEEGLAALHSILAHTYKSAVGTALRYVAVDFAQSHSFTELWKFLEKYTNDVETRWMITLREKRGMTDTSLPGGFSKDLVYFEGAYHVARWLHTHEYDCTQLYFGKLDIQDVEKAVQLNPNYQPLLPSFFEVNKQQYAEKMNEIAEFNHFLE